MGIEPSRGRVLELPNATEEERRAISHVLSAIKASRGMSYEKIYAAAVGSMAGYGLEDWKNLQKGILSQKKSAKLFRWIVENHLALGCEIAPEVFDPSLLTSWRDFTRKHGIYGKLSHRMVDALGLTERSARQPIADTPIIMGRDFVFDLDCAIDGQLLTLEMTGGHTYPFSIHPDEETLLIDIARGHQTLPQNADGTLAPLYETKDPGLRCYLFLIGSPELMAACVKGLKNGTPVGLDKLDQIALAFTKTDKHDPGLFELHGLNVVFVSTG